MPELFDWTAFLGDVASTAIGALLGFVFALVLNWWQSSAASRAKETELSAENATTLKLAIHACAIDTETLIGLKRQFVAPLIAETEKLRAAAGSRDPAQIVALMPTLRTFNLGYSDPAFLHLPDRYRFSFAVDDIPMLSTFVHRAEAALRTIEITLRDRNDMLREMSKATTRTNGATGAEVVYFSQMLIAYADNLGAVTDDALAFLRLLHDQIHNYGKHRFASGLGFRKFVLVGENVGLMPPDDYLNGYPDQFVDFSKPAPIPKDRPRSAS